MAKLNAKVTSDTNQRIVSKSGNRELIIELTVGNYSLYRLKLDESGMLTGYDEKGYSYSIGWAQYLEYKSYERHKAKT